MGTLLGGLEKSGARKIGGWQDQGPSTLGIGGTESGFVLGSLALGLVWTCLGLFLGCLGSGIGSLWVLDCVGSTFGAVLGFLGLRCGCLGLSWAGIACFEAV